MVRQWSGLVWGIRGMTKDTSYYPIEEGDPDPVLSDSQPYKRDTFFFLMTAHKKADAVC